MRSIFLGTSNTLRGKGSGHAGWCRPLPAAFPVLPSHRERRVFLLRGRRTLVGPAIALVLAGACADAAPRDEVAAITVVDDAGRTVRLAAPAARLVSLVPSVTEGIVALGAADRLVARTDYDTDPALAGLPSVGRGLTPNLEWLAARRPELVIAWPDARSRSVVERLAAVGVPVYGARVESLADLSRTIMNLGRLLAREAAADSLDRRFAAELDAVRRAVAGRPRVGVAYLVSLEPPIVSGPGTFIHELLETAGAENVFADAHALWPQVGLEQLVARQPEAVVVAQGEVSGAQLRRLRAAPGWRDLAAIRAGRLLEVDVDLFNRPGPRLPEAARRLAAWLHPSALAQETTP